MQLTLLDFDIADKEYRMALAYRIQAVKGVENREYRGMLACACLPVCPRKKKKKAQKKVRDEREGDRKTEKKRAIC